MEDTVFWAKVMKPARITIPDVIVELLDLQPGTVLEVKINKKEKDKLPTISNRREDCCPGECQHSGQRENS